MRAAGHAGIEKRQDLRRRPGESGTGPDVATTRGNAVLREHHSGVFVKQRRQATRQGTRQPNSPSASRPPDPADPSVAGSSDAFTPRQRIRRRYEPQRQAVAPGQRRDAARASAPGHLMPSQRQPYRNMAADGTRAEDTYSHGGGVPAEGSTSEDCRISTKLGLWRNPSCDRHGIVGVSILLVTAPALICAPIHQRPVRKPHLARQNHHRTRAPDPALRRI